VPEHTRRWRDYHTPAGRRPVHEFISKLEEGDRAEVAAAMKDVRNHGLVVARHLRGEVYEVRATGLEEEFRVLFATEGRRSQVLLSLEAFSKKTRKTPPAKIALAERRLADWRRRARG
jgi:phage-related protein